MLYTPPNIIASGITFAQWQAAGASGHLEKLISANTGPNASPTVAATMTAAGGGTVGGLLAPGVYYANFSETNGDGETLPSAESGPVTVAAQAAPTGTPTVVVGGSGGTLTAGVYFGKFTYVDTNLNAAGVHGETTAGTEFTFTQVGTDEPVITINDGGLPAWASGRNLYLTAVGGASGTEVLAFSGIIAVTYTILANPAASVVTPPAVNSTSTNIPEFTVFPALQTNNTARNIYLTPAGGASGTEVFYAEGVSAATFVFSTAVAKPNVAYPMPTTNGTGLSLAKLQLLRSFKDNNLVDAARFQRQIVTNFNSGQPVTFKEIMAKFHDVHFVWAMLAQMAQEAGVLLAANPGTTSPKVTGIGGSAPTRTWP